MSFSDVIKTRRSVRKYIDKKVEPEVLESVLNLAVKAPSWKNQQCWRFILVEDQDKKVKISECVPEGNPGRPSLVSAPYLLAMCAVPEDSGNMGNKDYYLVDCGIVFQTLMLAAHDAGLGTCFIGVFDEDKVKGILEIPENLRVVGLTPIGYADFTPQEKPRKDLQEIVSFNKYGEGWK